MSLEQPVKQSVSGSIERVTFHSEESGYCVLRLKVRGNKELVTLVGFAPSLSEGEFLEAAGEWIQHPSFGTQFKAESIQTSHPSTAEGIEKYLGSGMVKGIGPSFAKKMVAKFGAGILEIIEREPERLREVPGIGPGRLKQIRESWDEQKVIREIMVFLQSHGVGTGRAVRIYKTYGAAAIEKVTHNPYQLAQDVAGIGFKIADQIATNLGIPKDSVTRARAGLQHVLSEKLSDGHCGYPERLLVQETSTLLSISEALVLEAVALEITDTSLRRETVAYETCLFLAAAWTAERGTAELLNKLRVGHVPWGMLDTDKALEWVSGRLKVELSELQREAVGQALHSKFLVITGGPGTGKTTLTRAITSILEAKHARIALCSPTGRAAKRLSECTGMEAKTIHRLLGYDKRNGGFLHGKDNPLPIDLLLVDEASMVDIFLMYHLLKAVPEHAALVIVGDVDQIPSVGPGSVLQSIIDSQVTRTVRLTQVFRQAAMSRVIAAAHRINHGQMPEIDPNDKTSDFYFIATDSPTLATERVVDLVKNRIPKRFGFDSLKEIHVLCPMNKGGCGAQALNSELQKALNPNPIDKVERFGMIFAPGDKVMVTANDYDKEVFNGDIGIIASLDKENQTAEIAFDDRRINFSFGEMDILSLAYATTIHKAQGSEFPAVVLVLTMQHSMMLKRNLVYTAVTRGKKLVVVVGQRRAFEMAIRSGDQGKRWTKLAERLVATD